VAQGLATQSGITLLYLPSYSPSLNLIERLWKFIKRRALYGRYHPTFAQFQAAIQEVLDGLSTTHAEKLKSLMTLKFQRFEIRRCFTHGRVRHSGFSSWFWLIFSCFDYWTRPGQPLSSWGRECYDWKIFRAAPHR
jgi:hypothetical protein